MVTSLLSLMIFSAEANEIQSFEDGTFSPEIDNNGYRIYSTAESCEDVTPFGLQSIHLKILCRI